MLLRITKLLLLAALVGAPSLRAQSTPILSVAFEGNNAIQTPRLKNQLRVSREGGWYNPEVLKAELRGLEAFYQDEGFLRAKVGDPIVEFRPIPGKGQGALIRVPLMEGTRYSLGELEIQNAQALKPATFLRFSPLRSGQPYSRSKLAQWQEKIEESYRTMGHIRAETRLQEKIHEVRKVVDVVLDCLTGEFVDASLRLLPRGGRFIEPFGGGGFALMQVLNPVPDCSAGCTLSEAVEASDRAHEAASNRPNPASERRSSSLRTMKLPGWSSIPHMERTAARIASTQRRPEKIRNGTLNTPTVPAFW